MPVCASCHHENPDGFNFCGHCGAALPAAGCGACGFVNPPGLRFCGGCGGVLVASPLPVVARARTERRVATVMFADVVGFTAIAETSDPEALALRVDAALRTVAGVVVRHGGTVDKYLGDALMALFGVPIAHDDDAARAVAAALEIRATEGDLEFAIGINSGDVMVTPVGEAGDMTVIGDTVNVAARLQSAAGAGEILVGPLTAELVGTAFDLVERPPTPLKGRAGAVAVFEVLGNSVETEPSSDTGPPLLGRDAELGFLASAWQRATARSRGQVVLLAGEAGAGKTRLAQALADEVKGAALIVRAACLGYGALVGSHLARELHRQLAAGDGADDPAAGLDEHGVWRLRRLAWTLANRGLVEFQQGRVAAAAESEEAAMALFDEVGDLEGAAAAGRALALVRPDDPRVPALLADGLRDAEASGDLARERNALIPIAWSLFLRGQLGGETHTARALAVAERLAHVTDELGDAGFELQAHCICAIVHRLAGRLDDAARHVERGQAAARRTGMPQPLVDACVYMVAVARGGDAAAAPPPPAGPHPVELIAEAVVVQSMLYAGAFDAAVARLEAAPVTSVAATSPFFARLVGTTRGAVLVLATRYDEAADILALALAGARAVRAVPNEVAAMALLAEVRMCHHDPAAAAELIDAVDVDPGGIAGVLLLRARLLLGDISVTPALRVLAQQLAAPGLMPATRAPAMG